MIGGLTGEIPEGDVDGADGSHLGAGPAVVTRGKQEVGPDSIDLAGITTEQQWTEGTVDDGGFGVRAGISLAESGQAFVGVDADPEPVDRTGVDTNPTTIVNELEGGDLQTLCATAARAC